MSQSISSLLRRLLLVLTGCIIAPAPAPCAEVPAGDPSLPGYSEGCEIVSVSGADDQIDCIEDVVYAQMYNVRGSRQLRMTLLIPRNDRLKPCILYFPGGGFTTAVHSRYLEMRMALARRGYVVVACEYRPVPVKFPGLVQDAKAAIRYVRAHAAQYGIDPERIGVLGDSAGGYVVQMLGTTGGVTGYDTGEYLDQRSDVQAVCTIYGISDLTSIGEGFGKEIEDIHASSASTESLLLFGPAFDRNPGGSAVEDREKALAASALGNIRHNLPPFLIMHGSADSLVSPRQSARLFEALKRNGTEAEYVLVRGAAHGDLTWYQQPVIERVVNWFARTLGEPKAGAGRAE